MQVETFSHPKSRDRSVLGDDVMLHIPGRMTAVFDGATDAAGRRINGVSVGRLAAMAAAQATANLPPEALDWSSETILTTLSAAIARDVPTTGTGPASTTAMIAFEGPSHLRMVGIGDTGFRVNAREVQITELAPDQASIPARVALFKHLLAQGLDGETCEAQCRHYVGQGLDLAVQDQVLTMQARDAIIGLALMAQPDAANEVTDFLRGGLRHQYRFANADDHPLAYGVLNGQPPNCDFAVDQWIARNTLTSLEIFSDGYMSYPTTPSVHAWEQRHHDLEESDPSKIRAAPAVKGSTADNFFDDRTVAILTYG